MRSTRSSDHVEASCEVRKPLKTTQCNQKRFLDSLEVSSMSHDYCELVGTAHNCSRASSQSSTCTLVSSGRAGADNVLVSHWA